MSRPSSRAGGGGRGRRKLNGILLGGITVLALLIIGLAIGGGKSTPTGNTSPAATTTASPVGSVAGVVAKTKPTTTKKKPKPKRTHTAVAPSQAVAPSTPAQTTPAAAPEPPATTAPASCYPLTNGGNCYESGEYCRNADHGASGVAGDGEAITCEYNNGWRWEPA
jgi:hypothetical protein